MKIIVGIGNPGSEYERTRHNVGFDTVDAFARLCRIQPHYRERFSALAATCLAEGEKVLLLKPQTYVNLSGHAVQAALAWHNEEADSLLVICDDMNLPLGRIRIRRGGSGGGHKGLDSIAQALGGNNYPRLRIGIGQPEAAPPVDFVLSRFRPDERRVIDDSIERAAQAVRCWMLEGIEPVMNQYNAAPQA